MESPDGSGVIGMTTPEYAPGVRAPASGTYEQLNVLGSSTGLRVAITQGETLPAAPRGFTWIMVETRTDK